MKERILEYRDGDWDGTDEEGGSFEEDEPGARTAGTGQRRSKRDYERERDWEIEMMDEDGLDEDSEVQELDGEGECRADNREPVGISDSETAQEVDVDLGYVESERGAGSRREKQRTHPFPAIATEPEQTHHPSPYCPRYQPTPYTSIVLVLQITFGVLALLVAALVGILSLKAVGRRTDDFDDSKPDDGVAPSPAVRGRRRPNMAGAQKRGGPAKEIVDLTGRIASDGLDRYQLDFLETAEWVKDLLLKMKTHGPKLAEMAQKKPYKRNASQLLTFHTTTTFDFDFTIPHHVHSYGRDRTVAVSFCVGELVQQLRLTPAQHHKLLLLVTGSGSAQALGNEHANGPQSRLQAGALEKVAAKAEQETVAYDLESDTVTISCDTFMLKGQNKKWLSDTVDRLIMEARDLTDTFSDIPLDIRLLKGKQPTTRRPKRETRFRRIRLARSFPQQWLKPIEEVQLEQSA
ncbi:37S ribosomal protein S24, mitochondrial [Gonapodya sp. JEL0774]|nr:37S ribosomal protein S24, mitochondrial [Gonapodya sp. JEL0774]